MHHHVVAPVSPLTPSSPPMRWSSSTIKRLTFWTFFLCFQRLDRTSHFSGVPIITSPYNNKNTQPPLHYAIYSDIHSSPQTPPWSTDPPAVQSPASTNDSLTARPQNNDNQNHNLDHTQIKSYNHYYNYYYYYYYYFFFFYPR